MKNPERPKPDQEEITEKENQDLIEELHLSLLGLEVLLGNINKLPENLHTRYNALQAEFLNLYNDGQHALSPEECSKKIDDLIEIGQQIALEAGKGLEEVERHRLYARGKFLVDESKRRHRLTVSKNDTVH